MVLQLLPLAHRLDPDIVWADISVHVVDDIGIRAAHLQYFGKNTTTDVISQHYTPLPGEAGSCGEIIVNGQQALRARKRPNWSPYRELALYVAHGIDHLHGAEDNSPKRYQQMRRRELRWLRQIKNQGFSFDALKGSRSYKGSVHSAPKSVS